MITPGPWTVEQGGCYIVGDGHEIATMFPDHADDARLIAAAPELYRIVMYLATYLCQHPEDLGCHYCACRAVLAKIKGPA